jgi:hypothetical protein
MLENLLTHSCSIVQAGSTSDLGHTVASWTSGTTTTTGLACRLQARQERELATGNVISDYVLYALYGSVPASLLAHGAEGTHRVTNVLDGAGTTLDAGPFDVRSVQDQAGSQHHVKLVLKRTG